MSTLLLKQVALLTDLAREAICHYIISNSTRIGGHGKIVEIDRSLFFKRKYNRGRLRNQ